MKITAATALMFREPFRVERAALSDYPGVGFVGLEATRKAADAVARELTLHHGEAFAVVENAPEQIAAATALAGDAPVCRAPEFIRRRALASCFTFTFGA